MQTAEDLNHTYSIQDPWGFQSNPDDLKRKNKILDVLSKYGPFERALDIGAGEGWITKDLPSREIHAYEISEKAKSRLPSSVKGVDVPDGDYDLVIATGVLYSHYDVDDFFRILRKFSKKYILTSSISTWEHPEVSKNEGPLDFLKNKQIYLETFPYRQFTQILRVFKL